MNQLKNYLKISLVHVRHVKHSLARLSDFTLAYPQSDIVFNRDIAMNFLWIDKKGSIGRRLSRDKLQFSISLKEPNGGMILGCIRFMLGIAIHWYSHENASGSRQRIY